MTDDTIRLYENGRSTNIPVPDWLERAVAISSNEKLDWQHSVSRALGADHQGLTIDQTDPRSRHQLLAFSAAWRLCLDRQRS